MNRVELRSHFIIGAPLSSSLATYELSINQLVEIGSGGYCPETGCDQRCSEELAFELASADHNGNTTVGFGYVSGSRLVGARGWRSFFLALSLSLHIWAARLESRDSRFEIGERLQLEDVGSPLARWLRSRRPAPNSLAIGLDKTTNRQTIEWRENRTARG